MTNGLGRLQYDLFHILPLFIYFLTLWWCDYTSDLPSRFVLFSPSVPISNSLAPLRSTCHVPWWVWQLETLDGEGSRSVPVPLGIGRTEARSGFCGRKNRGLNTGRESQARKSIGTCFLNISAFLQFMLK